MQTSLTTVQIQERIRQIHLTGGNLSKKAVKASDPELMKNALYFFPSWESAVNSAVQH